MSIQVFSEVIGDYKTSIRWIAAEFGKPPREVRIDKLEYSKPCYYEFTTCRLYDSETRKPINDKVYGIPWNERMKND